MQNPAVPMIQGMGNGFPMMGTNQQGGVSCYLCGKTGHYARNCWAGGNGRPPPAQPTVASAIGDEETREFREYLREKIKKKKLEEERREREEEERRRREEENRKEQERLREAKVREAKLEARLVKLLAQHNKVGVQGSSSISKKKSLRTKARVLREITSYLEESEDDSEEVREEAGRLVAAIERRKGKKRVTDDEARVSKIRCVKKGMREDPVKIEEEEEEVRTPPRDQNGEEEQEILDFAIELHRYLSEKKVPELQKLCNREGIEWSKRDTAIGELVKCKAKLAYGEFAEKGKGRGPEVKRKKRRKGKRERGRRKFNALGGVLLKFNDQVSLIEVVKEMEGKGGDRWITSTGGDMWINRWRVVRRKIEETTLWVDGKEAPIKACKSLLEEGGTYQVGKVAIMPSGIEHRKFVLRDVLRQPWKVRGLYKKRAQELIALFRTGSRFGHRKTRNRIKNVVNRVVRRKFGAEIRRRPCVKVPFSPELKMGEIREVAGEMIRGGGLDVHVAGFVAGRVRVVTTKKASVGMLLHNPWKYAEMEEVFCSCEGMHLPRYDDHVRVRLDDISELPRFIWNSRNVTKGDAMSPAKLEKCIWEGVREWVIENPGVTTRMAGCYKQGRESRSEAMSATEVRRVFSCYSRLVAVPIDRNPGTTLLICPVAYH
ncbi:hypothetical protein CBR_g26249 [Chara braunii]|uniref:CCHC-type domain-containing protein n=1 Tax=Chara braunii TaxID=69332 RepID=A0A388L7E3_CHABU|nr:hypothetical protein CBR_g26249 [Chara braunii]|eukprot:GBG78216.1 hypothetical protein CBR_g26249 [Chara braunii]